MSARCTHVVRACVSLGSLLTTTGKSIWSDKVNGTTSSAGARHVPTSAPAPATDTRLPSGSWYCGCVSAPSSATVAFVGVSPFVSVAA